MLKTKVFLLIGFVVFGLFAFGNVKAGIDDNVSGWAWSENIGWISFNNTTGGGSIVYGVNIDPSNGSFSGYAWSENIGWISFDELYTSSPPFDDPCADTSCIAKVTSFDQLGKTNVDIKGWARALVYDDSWDGWIRFDHGQTGEVYIDKNGDFHGWAWSSDVIGWISFNSSDPSAGGTEYKVTLDLSKFNQPPSAANPSVDPYNSTDYCEIIGYPPVRVRWEYFDIDDIPEGTDPQSAYEIEVFKVSGGMKVIDTGKKSGGTESYVFQIIGERLEWNISYNWQIMVWDSQDTPSDWAEGPSFITILHPYPDTDFSWIPESPAADELIQFTDETTYYNGAISWNWLFGDGNTSTEKNPTHSYPDTQIRTVNLKACDNIGCCSVNKEIRVSLPLPEWEEIAPF